MVERTQPVFRLSRTSYHPRTTDEDDTTSVIGGTQAAGKFSVPPITGEGGGAAFEFYNGRRRTKRARDGGKAQDGTARDGTGRDRRQGTAARHGGEARRRGTEARRLGTGRRLGTKAQDTGRLDDSYIIRFMKEKLKSMPCQNQGYVLDGYPKTYEQAKELFNSEEGEEEEESRSKAPRLDKTITPGRAVFKVEILIEMDAYENIQAGACNMIVDLLLTCFKLVFIPIDLY
ncbi:uncharacterized protein LOC143962129 [Lithobates pipiens]